MSVRRLADESIQPAAFAFSQENLAWAEKKIREYPVGRQQSAVIPLLMRAQDQDGWITRAAATPPPPQLPESTRARSTRNAGELSDPRWLADISDLIRRLESRGIPPREPGAAIGASPAAMQQVAVIALVHFIPNLSA